ncbi:ATP phosphoribosyltransferase regulatory subunit [Zongyangia hominis]|uniref:ATP phosphoribosyltransferase regulatory subunit n=1 Tax=Zongyangia hominis TaxID=2763677 RepID=A0A926I9Z1_9FIRM|nr:ATP phosphoribosyltransferase regulatory subunit [Zongyangia hominis]MBC8569671.1 ATP phosphoribosyltransferase regulatory subunit [Zongyangia hominis]
MKIYDKITPEGTRDLLFEECQTIRWVTAQLEQEFESHGYGEVMTPAIEFFDVFSANSTYFPQESMYKLIDNKGRIIVLRPDMTTPIARLTATRMQNQPIPLRFYYNGKIYRVTPSHSGRSDETFQMGVELIGAGTARSDLEVIALAGECLKRISPDAFRIELGHIGLFKGLMARLDADDYTKEEIRRNIEAKNYGALNTILDGFGGDPAAAALKKLPSLFGGAEVFDRARELSGLEEFSEILDYLKSVYESLGKLGLGGQVIIDLGIVNQGNYYTGVIFRGYLEGIGEPLVSGGRYDNLLRDFGADLAATGFGIDINLAVKFLMKNRSLLTPQPSKAIVFGRSGYETKAIEYTKRLIGELGRCELSVFDTEEETRAYAKEKGIGKLYLIGEDITIVELGGEVQ